MDHPRMELTDFMAEYPSIDDKNIQTKISAKWEFASLASYPEDVTLGPTGFFRHQDLIERLMRVYNRQILIHGTGTGKSYLIGDVGEYARKEYHGRGIRGVIVVVKGKPQMIDIIKTLVCKSTHGYYMTNSILYGTTERGMKSAASRSLKRWYDVRSYGTFAKHLSTLDDATLRSMYSDYLIIFDEFHNTRILDDKVSIHQSGELTPGQNVTLQMWRLSHLPLRTKVIGLSASLIINDVNEAIGTLNLILPIDRQIPDNSKIQNMTTDELAKYVNGYVSYVSSPDVHVYRWRQGVEFNETVVGDRGDTYRSQLVLKLHGMSELQSKIYARAFDRDIRTDNGKARPGFRINARQASKGVFPPTKKFPEGSWGMEGFMEHFTRTDNGWYKASKHMKEYYKGDRLGILSISALEAIKIARATDGLVVIFDEYVDGSGLNYLAIAMDNMGFQRHDPTTSIFRPKGSSGPAPYCGGVPDLDASTEIESDKERTIRPDFMKQSAAGYLRYVMITKDTKNAQLSNILELCGSNENVKGEYLRVVMISGRAKEGISFSNMAVFIQYGGVWTPTTEYQAESRGLRTTSHVLLHADMIQRLMMSGMNDRELEVAKRKGATPAQLKEFANPMSREDAEKWGYVIVDTYKFASVVPDVKGAPRREDGSKYPSIDILMYLYAEDKNRQFKQFIRKLKELAIDCQIHKRRNVRAGDKDGSEECDYDVCDYKCYSKSPHHIDYTTSDVYYMKESVNDISPSIEDYFRKNGSGTIENIRTSIGNDVRVRYIEAALTDMILNRKVIRDRFGYSVFIREDNGIFYITRDFPSEDVVADDQSSSFYGSTYIMTQRNDIDRYIGMMEVSEIDNVIQDLRAIDPKQKNYETVLDNAIKAYEVTQQVLILEYVMDKALRGDKDPFIMTAAKTFKHVVFSLNEPRELIEEKAEEMRARKGQREKKVERENFDEMQKRGIDIGKMFRSNDPVVYIHSLNTHIPNRAAFSDVSQVLKAEGQIRIYNPATGKWEDTNEYQSQVYNLYIQWKIYQRVSKMDQKYDGSVYGVILGRNFRVRVLTGDEKLKKGKAAQPTGNKGKGRGKAEKEAMTGTVRKDAGKDMRTDPTGRVCSTNDKGVIINQLWMVTEDSDDRPMPTKKVKFPTDEVMKETIYKESNRKLDAKGWSKEKLKYFYAWYKMDKKGICQVLFHEMFVRNQILYLR